MSWSTLPADKTDKNTVTNATRQGAAADFNLLKAGIVEVRSVLDAGGSPLDFTFTATGVGAGAGYAVIGTYTPADGQCGAMQAYFMFKNLDADQSSVQPWIWMYKRVGASLTESAGQHNTDYGAFTGATSSILASGSGLNFRAAVTNLVNYKVAIRVIHTRIL